MAEGCTKGVKYSFYITNCIILICGISAFAFGIWTLADRAFMERVLGKNLYVSSLSIVVASGVIITLVFSLGCLGANKEIKWMLLTFFIVLFLVVIIVIAGGILGYVTMTETEQGDNETWNQMSEEMLKFVPYYGEATPVTQFWDYLQENLECCGLIENNDDGFAIWRTENTYLQLNNKTVPDSCCKNKDNEESIQACQDDPRNHVYKKDCYVAFNSFKKESTRHNIKVLTVGGIGIGVSCLLMIVGMVLSCTLYLKIK